MDWASTLTRKRKELIGQIVKRKGFVSDEQIKEAIDFQHKHGGPIGEILVKLGFINEDNLVGALAEQFGIPYMPPSHYDIDEKMALVLPKELMLEHFFIPVSKEADILWVIFANPLDKQGIESLKDITGCKIVPFLAKKEDIIAAINELYET